MKYKASVFNWYLQVSYLNISTNFVLTLRKFQIMKKTIILLSGLLLISSLLWQCSPTVYTKADFPAKHLSFGKGGGFKGVPTTYHLLPNGQIFKSEGMLVDTLELFSIKKEEAKAFFKRADNAHLEKIDFYNPGNMYQFIEYHTEKDTSRIVWGDNKTELAAEIKDIYKKLNNLVVEFYNKDKMQH